MTLRYVLLFKIISWITFYIILHIAFIYYVLHFAFHVQIILCITLYSRDLTSATSGPAAQSGGERTSHDISGRVDGLASHIDDRYNIYIIRELQYAFIRVQQPRRRRHVDDSYNIYIYIQHIIREL